MAAKAGDTRDAGGHSRYLVAMAKQDQSAQRESGSSRSGDGTPRPGWPRMHLWEIQPLRDATVVLVVVGLLYLGYVLRVVTVPLLLALLLAYLFEPVVQWLTKENQRNRKHRKSKRKGMSRAMAAVAIIVAAAVLVVVPVLGGVAIGTVEGVKLVRAVGTNLRTVVRFVDSAVAPETDESH